MGLICFREKGRFIMAMKQLSPANNSVDKDQLIEAIWALRSLWPPSFIDLLRSGVFAFFAVELDNAKEDTPSHSQVQIAQDS